MVLTSSSSIHRRVVKNVRHPSTEELSRKFYINLQKKLSRKIVIHPQRNYHQGKFVNKKFGANIPSKEIYCAGKFIVLGNFLFGMVVVQKITTQKFYCVG